MYGRFKTTELQQFAKDEAARLRREQKIQKERREQEGTFEADDIFHTYDGHLPGTVKSKINFLSLALSRLVGGGGGGGGSTKFPLNCKDHFSHHSFFTAAHSYL